MWLNPVLNFLPDGSRNPQRHSKAMSKKMVVRCVPLRTDPSACLSTAIQFTPEHPHAHTTSPGMEKPPPKKKAATERRKSFYRGVYLCGGGGGWMCAYVCLLCIDAPYQPTHAPPQGWSGTGSSGACS